MKDIDLNEIDFSRMGSWPVAGKLAFVLGICLVILVLGYFVDIQAQRESLQRAAAKEQELKEEFKRTYAKVANLDTYQIQMQQMQASFGSMLRQLPSKTEVDGLLVDISQTGHASGIEFKLFKPEQERLVDFYAELPIRISMTGNYHQFGNFVSGIAALPRIVTLHDISIKQGEGGETLTMDMTAKTYRYLDDKEVAKQKTNKKKKS